MFTKVCQNCPNHAEIRPNLSQILAESLLNVYNLNFDNCLQVNVSARRFRVRNSRLRVGESTRITRTRRLRQSTRNHPTELLPVLRAAQKRNELAIGRGALSWM